MQVIKCYLIKFQQSPLNSLTMNEISINILNKKNIKNIVL